MTTGIEWTDETWNPTVGCTHVSEGCDNCYAAALASGRLSKTPLYAGLAVDGKFTGRVRLVPDRLEMPLHWRTPRMVFVDSMSDLFHDAVPDEFIARVFLVMGEASRHTFQVLTKRPGRMASWFSRVARSEHGWLTHNGENPSSYGGSGVLLPEPWPLSNVWMGTSVENQKWADVRIPKLLEIPAAVRFLSCEPLLGPIELRTLGAYEVHGGPHRPGVIGRYGWDVLDQDSAHIDWVIVGGESGREARPMHPGWGRSIRDQCVAAGVPFFFKQWGEFAPARRDEAWQVGTEFWPVWRYGKKRAGRELDGRTWDEMPAASEGVIESLTSPQA